MKILVLAGGDSGERAVSFDSGAAICQALKRLGHEVQALDPATGANLIGDDGQFLIGEGGPPQPTGAARYAPLTEALATRYADVDLVFNALHGGSGEDGTIQNLLELAGKKFTGSDQAASATAMNKAEAKNIMASLAVPTPRWKLFRVGEEDLFSRWASEIANEFEMPLIVKPNSGGSTIGLTKVDKATDIDEALRLAADQSNEILIEAFIDGRELTVSVFDSKAFPVVEIKPVGRLYDYEAKYTKGKSEYVVPAEVEADLAGELQRAAVNLYEALGVTGLARVDFVIDANREFFCLEMNTLPGMTALSLAPMALACEGISFDQLIQMIIDSTLRK